MNHAFKSCCRQHGLRPLTDSNSIPQVRDRRLRFLISGGLAFGINMLIALVFFQMDWTQSSDLNKNISNMIITEISMLLSFALHNYFTWNHDKAHRLLKRFFHFHLASGFGLSLRFISFAVLVAIDLHVYAATVISVLTAAVSNYFCYDRLVFKAPQA